MVQIKKNDYVQPTECREEVVQMICDCFLQEYKVCGKCYSGTHEMMIDNEVYIYRCKGNPEYLSFAGKYDSYLYRNCTVIEKVRLRTCEVREAIRVLREAGYRIYRYEYRLMNHLCLSNKELHPMNNVGFVPIFDFDINID